MQSNIQQLTMIGIICNQLNINKEAKAIMVQGFSNGRETSSKNLTKYEADLMIAHLQTLQKQQPTTHDAGEAMRKKILSYCHQINWTITKPNGKKIADVNRFNEWAKNYSYLKKKLNEYKYKELPKLVSQFEAVYKSFLNKV